MKLAFTKCFIRYEANATAVLCLLGNKQHAVAEVVRLPAPELSRVRLRVFCFLQVALLLLSTSCTTQVDTGEDPNVTSRGSLEVSARLEEIRGDLIDDPMYDYAHVMKYRVLQVHRGQVDQDTIYVGHYNPAEPRDSVADARVQEIGGNVKEFRTGDVHRMALEVPIDDYYMGGIINKYFGEIEDPIHWAVWTNKVKQ